MLRQTLEDNSISDLQKLVTGGVTESVRIEFKRDNYRLSSSNPDDKKRQCKELLKDVSAFANSQGGDLIIGIEENNGAASSLVGVQTPDIDNLKRQMIAIIRNGTDPRIQFAIHTIPVASDHHAIVIRVQQGAHAPHRVVYQGEQCGFWGRDSGGAHELDAREIADLSRRSQSLSDQITDFRRTRVEAIGEGNMPIELPTRQKLVLHLIPEAAFQDFHIEQQDLGFFLEHMPILHFTGGWSQEHNVNGMVSFDRQQGIPPSGYVQLYRSGIVESVADDVTFFLTADVAQRHRLFKTDYRQEVPSRFRNYFELYRRLGVNPPIWLFISFVGLDGVEILSNDFLRSTGRPIREVLLLAPGVEVDDFTTDPRTLLKPGWDYLWQAAGYPGSP